MQRGRTAAAALALAVTSLLGFAGTSSADATGATGATSDHLNRGSTLWAGSQIESSTRYGYARLVMQTDGNLVLYGSNWGVCWASHTYGSGGNRAVYQPDGNFVVYSNKGDVWASHTMGSAGTNVNINWNGEVWVGVTRLTGACG
ncbi:MULTISPECIES: hypothetical protein [Streptomyces]|uniref:hypothetical protein n=1 Tax=Streptomyces TaxID=1883 RepID=UPI000F77FA82|nr:MULTISPECIES: hypothetical protein [Streptomyces]RSS99955.1 hypothetical protein EF910_33665 [Streptomyces sp. WAC07149]GLX23380.1 hypothetical protein Slala01_70240 [Streptomyces lavendulae subsp. lavendulae]GLX31324.1 hypothetical protein Slala02_71430 [Streptomyces lavendulae subsp. lavendulae]